MPCLANLAIGTSTCVLGFVSVWSESGTSFVPAGTGALALLADCTGLSHRSIVYASVCYSVVGVALGATLELSDCIFHTITDQVKCTGQIRVRYISRWLARSRHVLSISAQSTSSNDTSSPASAASAVWTASLGGASIQSTSAECCEV